MTSKIVSNTHDLGHEYTFWYHNPNDIDWSNDSYHQILTIKSVEEFWLMNNNIKKESVENGMFFMMVDNVFPVWEDPNNINGCSVSWKVERKYAYQYWTDILVHLLSENFINPEQVTGVSISPKKQSNIIKLWYNIDFKDGVKSLVYPDTLKLYGIIPLYKSHSSQIERDKQKNDGQSSYKYYTNNKY